MTASDYRWKDGFPKIGIRPTIDGRRRGVRESLEEQTMNLAKAVAKLLTSELKYPNGNPVECVIADTCIGGVAEAAAAAKKFKQSEVGLTITVTPCWCYGTETMDTDASMPKAVWGFNGTGRPGAVYLAAVLSAHAQKGIPAFGIYGEDVQDEGDDHIPDDVQEKLLRFARSGLAVAMMRDKAYLSMGSVSMGIAGSIVNDSFFQEYLGMRNEYIDMSEFTRRIDEEIYDPEEYKLALAWVKENCTEGPDNNPEHLQTSRERKDQEWETVVKMTLIARDLMIGNPRLAELGFGEEANGHHAIASGFQGQRQWTDHFPNGDFMETMMNSSFDWNGLRAPFTVATENDSLNGVGMLFGNLLTNTAQIFADVRTYWSPASVERVAGYKLEGRAANGILHLINSGSAALDGTGEQKIDGKPALKPFWKITEEEVQATLGASQWRPASVEYFRGGGFSTDYLTRGGMPMTMTRLNLVKGLGPVLQIAEGYSVDLPQDVHDTLDKRTDPTWPTTWFAPILTGNGAFTSVYDVMDNWGANHGAISYGHIGADLITLASMLRIPVSMHNVPKERIFRPRAWGMFGTEQSEGADFRACENFGPLYK
ncbi:L-fucose isomerase [Paenibacillus motobuensis]|uniref:L-fucose isomerase n=1 Tax=Paenibacillus TaxID=44249 RepID=UPI00204095ED|nr:MULTISPECIES: L-fucose isomerase [Paenibacillus]MCM3040702.1 L-fucose isomerase [Paenibacillus lutimineralis]MCM3647806.1 L-fucose isomerase [Paenibacillus motobuensis]